MRTELSTCMICQRTGFCDRPCIGLMIKTCSSSFALNDTESAPSPSRFRMCMTPTPFLRIHPSFPLCLCVGNSPCKTIRTVREHPRNPVVSNRCPRGPFRVLLPGVSQRVPRKAPRCIRRQSQYQCLIIVIEYILITFAASRILSNRRPSREANCAS